MRSARSGRGSRPASSWKPTPLMSAGRIGAVAKTTRSSSSRPRGAGNASSQPAEARRGPVARAAATRRAPRPAPSSRRSSCSTGCSARPSRMVAATMIPGEAFASITSQAPRPSIATCRPWRAMRATRREPAQTSLPSAACASSSSSCRVCQLAIAAARHAHADDHLGIARQRFGVTRWSAREPRSARSAPRARQPLGQHAQGDAAGRRRSRPPARAADASAR